MQLFYLSTSLLAMLTSFLLAVYVLSRNSEGAVNRAYSLLSLCLGIWICWDVLSVLFADLDDQLLLLLAQFCHLFALFVPLLYLNFIHTLVGVKRRLLSALFLLGSIIVLAAVGLNFQFIVGFTRTPVAARSIGGAAFDLFSLLWLLSGVAGISELLLARSRQLGQKRRQISYVLVASGLAYAGGAFYFLSLIGLTVPPLDNFFLFLYMSIIAYAIVKHQLMDIALAIKKTTAYSLVTTAITFTYVLVVVGFELLFRAVYGHYSFWASIPAALVIAVTFVPLRERVQGVTDRLFFRRMIEYQKVLKEITSMIASVTDLHTLFRLIDRTVVRVMCLKNASVLLLEEKENQYIVEKTNGVPGIVGLRLPLDDALVQYLIEKKDAVVLEEVRSLLKTAPAGSPECQKLALVAEGMGRFNAAIAIPSFLKEKLVGILNLGEKLSGELYSPDDIELLLTLASEAAIAIENAKLYRDITETRDYLNSLVESSDDAILTLDLDGKVLSWNQGAAKIFGSKSQETIGRIPPFISQVELNTLIGKVAAGQEVRSLALTQRTREGRDLPLLLTLSSIKDHNGKLVGISAILTDISELKKVDRLKHEFLSVISHELRTPLTPIKGYLTLLLEGKMGELPPKQRQALEIVLKQSGHLHDLIDSVIDISRIEAGRKIELDKEPLFLGELIEGCLAANEANLKIKQIDLARELPAERAALLGDRKKLLRLMDNLLSNAIKFTPLKGEIRVKLEKRGRYFQVTLSDSGLGLAADELEKVFEPFYQVDTSYTRSSGGMGMGLTIAKEIVEAHGGRIWAESDGPGKGSRFIFTV